MKKILGVLLLIAMMLSLAGCGNSVFSAKNEIKIEDIDWDVTESILDGERFVSFNYTNNSKYTIVDVEMKFVQKSDVTSEQLSVFDRLKESGTWTDDEIADIYILGFNRKCADPGETVSNSPCCINGTYNYVKTIKEYEIMEPDMATITFIGKDGKGYITYYDFKTQKYSESSQSGYDVQKWADNEFGKQLPKVEATAIGIISDDEDFFSFAAYGTSKETYDKYIDSVKASGFNEVVYETNTSFCATNSNDVEVSIYYSVIEEEISGSVLSN